MLNVPSVSFELGVTAHLHLWICASMRTTVNDTNPLSMVGL